jgi:flagellin
VYDKAFSGGNIMTSIINTNMPSLTSQRHLGNTSSDLATALERLSSGKRINHAKDDAAGLGIAARMTGQINGMNQAIRNAYDGISLGQTAEGALSKSVEMLQRIRTLAVQSSNASNSANDRKALQEEVAQLTAELNRIAQTTTFNGQYLLNGTMGTANYQVGANAGELISANGTNFLTKTYGDQRTDNGGANADVANRVAAGTLTINGNKGTRTIVIEAGQTALDIAQMVNDVTADTDVTASAKTEQVIKFAAGAQSITLKADNASATTINFSIRAGSGTSPERSLDAFAAAINSINAQSAKTGVTAEYFDDGKTYGIKLAHVTGQDITIGNNGASKIRAFGIKADGKAMDYEYRIDQGASAVITGQLTFDSQYSFSLNDTSGITPGTQSFAAGAGTGTSPVTTTNTEAEIDAADNGLTPGDISFTLAGDDAQKVAVTTSSSAKSIAADINALGIAGVTATVKDSTATIALTTSTTAAAGVFDDYDFNVTIGDKTVRVNKANISALSTDATAAAAAGHIISYLNAEFGSTVAELSGTADIKITDAEGNNIVVDQLATSTTDGAISVAGATGSAVAMAAAAAKTATVFGALEIASDGTHVGDLEIKGLTATGLGTDPTTAIAGGTVSTNAKQLSDSELKSVSEIDVSTFAGAQLAIAIADAGINTINSEIARYGALQTRFENTIGNLEINVENTTNARSRIEDTDYAAETANLSRYTILQQAGTSMLAQANQQPQLVLSLLQ